MEDLHEMSWKSSPDDAWILANWHPRFIRTLYCDVSYWGTKALEWESIRQYRKRNKKFLARFKGMEKPTPYEDMGAERERVRKVRNVAPKVGQTAAEHTVITVPIEHLPYHEKLQEALSQEGRIEKAVFESKEGSHQGYIKNADNEIEYTRDMPNHQTRAKFEVNFDTAPKWPVVSRVEGVKIPRKESAPKHELGGRFAGIGDLQIPFVDLYALSIALQISRDAKPTVFANCGDILDMTEFSKYIQRPEFSGLLKPSSRIARRMLEMQRRMMPSAKIIYQNGNHENRSDIYMLQNAKEAYGITPADKPEGWPAMTIPWLLSLDNLDIEHMSFGPPIWLSDNLQIKHRAAGRGPSAVSRNERYNTVYFDNHRIETQYRSYPHSKGVDTYGVFGVGSLCLSDGIPGVKTTYDAKGRPDKNSGYDWQQGMVIADFDPNGIAARVDNNIRIDTFNGYDTVWNGKLYKPNAEIIKEIIGRNDPEAWAMMLNIDPRLKEFQE